MHSRSNPSINHLLNRAGLLLAVIAVTGCNKPAVTSVTSASSTTANPASTDSALDRSIKSAYDDLKKAEHDTDSKAQLQILTKLLPLLQQSTEKQMNPEGRKEKGAQMIEAAKQAVTVTERLHGSDKPEMLLALGWLEQAGASAGDREVRNDALERQVTLSESLPMVAKSPAFLITLERWAKSKSPACGEPLNETRLRKWVALKEKFLGGPDAVPVLESKFILAAHLVNSGKFAESETILKDVIAKTKDKAPALATGAMLKLAKVLSKEKKDAQAVKMYSDCLALVAPGKKYQNEMVFEAAIEEYGFMLYSDKKFKEACKIYKLGLDDIQTKANYNHAHFQFWLGRYIECMNKTGQAAEAKTYKAQIAAEAEKLGVKLDS